MKKIILIFFCFLSVSVYAQKIPDYGLNRVRITQRDQSIIAELEPESSAVSAKSSLHYYWYSANIIHETQGGYSGRLLGGQYSVFYPNKTLKEQGSFRKGLKVGVWKIWQEDGTLLAATTWKHGIDVTGKQRSLWKRLPLIHKRHRGVDSLNASKNK
ncbi:MAG TPA: hypothetical protein VL442_08900 [Mucilaginibacter sp.]|nr:hypothetical protein [Mucilaginibacter sp.]